MNETTCILPEKQRDPFEIDFIGNERDLIFATRAIQRLHTIANDKNLKYNINLYGRYPPGMLHHIEANFTWIGDKDDHAHQHAPSPCVIKAANYERKVTLVNYYELAFKLMPLDWERPLFSPRTIPCKIQHQLRARVPTEEFGNTVFFHAPSTEDDAWNDVFSRGKFFEMIVGKLLEKKYCTVYPQIFLSEGHDDSAYNHRLYFSGSESLFGDYCYMPEVNSLETILFWLLQSCMYVGWDNWIGDMAKALSIPCLILSTTPTMVSDYHIAPRCQDAIIETLVLPRKEAWNAHHFEQAFSRFKKGFHPRS